MGATVCDAVRAAADLELVAALDVGDDLDELVRSAAHIAIDFTTPDAVMGNLEFCVGHGVNVVVGTTGFDAGEALDGARLGRGCPERRSRHRAQLRYRCGLDDGVRRESGALLRVGRDRRVASPAQDRRAFRHRTADCASHCPSPARRQLGDMPDATSSGLDGARGAEVDGVHIHAVRLQGLIAHQEVLFGGVGETLSIRHDSLDRASFMPGVLMAVRAVGVAAGVDRWHR